MRPYSGILCLARFSVDPCFYKIAQRSKTLGQLNGNVGLWAVSLPPPGCISLVTFSFSFSPKQSRFGVSTYGSSKMAMSFPGGFKAHAI